MKKIAMIFSVAALIFAFSTTQVSAQKAPKKAKTEKVADTKDVKTEGCADKAKAADCPSHSGDKAKAGCTTPCPGGAKATPGCCAGKAAAKPVPAPESTPEPEKK